MKLKPLILILAALSLSACSSPSPMRPVAHVEVDRYMGPWYVIASIPSRLERDAYNAVETYERRADGKIQTTFRFRNGGFDGKLKVMHPVGTVQPGSNNAIWGMQFIWPIQAEYVIAYLDPDYRQVIVGRSKRDYVWIMARTPAIDARDYDRMVTKVAELGYSTDKLRKVPQKWPEPSGDATTKRAAYSAISASALPASLSSTEGWYAR